MPIRVTGRNQYAERCVQCGGRVPAGSGYRGNMEGSWVTWCATHKPDERQQEPETTDSGIHMDLSEDGRQVDITMRGRLPRDAFNRYISVKRECGVRSAQIDGIWRDSCTIPNMGAVWKALSDHGFTVTGSPRAVAALQGAAAQQQADDTAVQARLNHPKAAGLFPFQRVGVQWLSSRTGGILADEMGCGKTVQTLMALGDKRPVLLVVPASLKLNWAKEAAKWRPEYKVTVLKGRGTFRYPKPGELVIVNYDILPPALPLENYRLPALTGVFANPPARMVVVADEAHSVKNAKAQRTERFRFLGEVARSTGGQVWLLTGTPLLNRPPELWSVFTSGGIAREAFGSFERFKQLFNAEQGRFGIEWGPPTREVAECIRRVQLRREKKDVLTDLPAKTRKIVPVEADGVSRTHSTLFARVLSRMEEHERQQVRRASTEATEAIGEGMPGFEDFSRALTALALAKTDATIEYVEGFMEEGLPFLVFSSHIEPLKKVQEAIEKAGKKCGIIIGEVSPEQRQRVVEDFQAGRLDAVCIGIRAGGVGLTLTRATHSIFIDLEVVPALNVQAEDRIHRIGQTLPVTIHQMVLNHPLDEHINNLISKKMELFGQTVGASTFMPTEQAPANTRASALTQAAQAITISRTQPARAPVQPVRVQHVTFQTPQGERTAVVPMEARQARTERERWAADAIAQMTEMDGDQARQLNGMGWNMGDSRIGHTMNALIQRGHGLTDAQWVEAIAILHKYRRQIGTAPGQPDEQERATRRRMEGQTQQPAQVSPAVNAPAPAAPRAQGVGIVGRYASGEVRCVGAAPLRFQTADGRIVASYPRTLHPSTQGHRFVTGQTYRVRFKVTEHRETADGELWTIVDELELPDRPVAPANRPLRGTFAGIMGRA